MDDKQRLEQIRAQETGAGYGDVKQSPYKPMRHDLAI
jgi:hypothetical protein